MSETDTSDHRPEVERIRVRALNLEHPPGIARADIRVLLDEIERLRPYEPDHAAVRAAQAMAADVIERHLADAGEEIRVHMAPREIANVCAAELRDHAHGARAPRDDGGNLDHRTLNDIALEVDAFTSLDEMRDKVADLRRAVTRG